MFEEDAYCFRNIILEIQKSKLFHLLLHCLQVAMPHLGRCASSTIRALHCQLSEPHVQCREGSTTCCCSHWQFSSEVQLQQRVTSASIFKASTCCARLLYARL